MSPGDENCLARGTSIIQRLSGGRHPLQTGTDCGVAVRELVSPIRIMGSIHGHHQMVNSEIRLIIFFAAKDGEALYSQQKQDQELTVTQTMNSLLPNSD